MRGRLATAIKDRLKREPCHETHKFEVAVDGVAGRNTICTVTCDERRPGTVRKTPRLQFCGTVQHFINGGAQRVAHSTQRRGNSYAPSVVTFATFHY